MDLMQTVFTFSEVKTVCTF